MFNNTQVNPTCPNPQHLCPPGAILMWPSHLMANMHLLPMNMAPTTPPNVDAGSGTISIVRNFDAFW